MNEPKYRICKLDGCDVWRVEVFAIPRWPFRLWMAPRWLPVYETHWADMETYFREPVERDSHIAAVRVVEQYEAASREAEARRARAWKCGAA